MANVIIDDTHLTSIANAIRSKNGSSDTYTPAQMATAISNISGGGSSSTTLEVNQVPYKNSWERVWPTVISQIDGTVTLNINDSVLLYNLLGLYLDNVFKSRTSSNHDLSINLHCYPSGDTEFNESIFVNAMMNGTQGTGIRAEYLFDQQGTSYNTMAWNTGIGTYGFMQLPEKIKIYNFCPTYSSTFAMFSTSQIAQIHPRNFVNLNGSLSDWQSLTATGVQSQRYMFAGSGLIWIDKSFWGDSEWQDNRAFEGMFQGAGTLRAIDDLPLPRQSQTITTNMFVNTFYQTFCLGHITFKQTSAAYSWKNQVIDLTTVGYDTEFYGFRFNYFANSNQKLYDSNNTLQQPQMTYVSGVGGISVNKPADGQTYDQGFMPYYYYTDTASYSLFGWQEAEDFVASLPDTSAYVQAQNATNTIKLRNDVFSSYTGLNTMVAAALAKGWTVTLV